MNSISPPIFPAISSESIEVVDDAVREADDKQVQELLLILVVFNSILILILHTRNVWDTLRRKYIL